MSKVLTDPKNYTDIANAIRSKNGSTNTYKPSEMASAIESISSGSGGGNDPHIHTERKELKNINSAGALSVGISNELSASPSLSTALMLDAVSESNRPVARRNGSWRILPINGEYDFDDTVTMRYIDFNEFFQSIDRDVGIKLFNNILIPEKEDGFGKYIKALNSVNGYLLDSDNANTFKSGFVKYLCLCLNGGDGWSNLISCFLSGSTIPKMPSGAILRTFASTTAGWHDDMSNMVHESTDRFISTTMSGYKSEYTLESGGALLHFAGKGLCVGIAALDVPDTVTACVFDEGIDAYYADSCNSSTITKWIFKAPQGKKVTLADGNTKKWFASSKSSSSSKPVYDIYTDNQNIRDYAFSSNITVNFHALSEWTGV